MDVLDVLCTHTLPISFVGFMIVYLFAYFLLFGNWGPKHRATASSSFMSLTHGTPAVILAINALYDHQNPRGFGSLKIGCDNVVMEFSMGYFLMDLVHYMVFFPRDVMFILHHVATLYALAIARYLVDYGSYGILMLIVLAEVTGACQNIWSLAGYRKTDVPAAKKLYDLLSFPFLAFYSVVRGVIGPIFVFKMGVFYVSGGAAGLVPGWIWVSWMVIAVPLVLVSILWVSKHWKVWHKMRTHTSQKKLY